MCVPVHKARGLSEGGSFFPSRNLSKGIRRLVYEFQIQVHAVTPVKYHIASIRS